MKKTLFVLSVIAVFVSLSCSSKSDCDCTVSWKGMNAYLFTQDEPTFTDIEKDCDEINWEDISKEFYDVWTLDEITSGRYTLSCVEH